MKIYLDTCSLQRPLDTKSQPRILLEAEAVLTILELCGRGDVDLIASEVLLYETHKIPTPPRKEYALELLAKATLFVGIDEMVEERARELRDLGIHPLDALHLAAAERARADFFCTCDDRLLKKAKRMSKMTQAVSPVELLTELER